MKQQTFRLNDAQLKALEDARRFMGHTKQEALLRGLEAYLKRVEALKAKDTRVSLVND